MSARRAGLLLHPTSLPGPYGVGDIGPNARRLLHWLDAAGLRIWQVLPLLVTDENGCPYASPSAFAAEPLLLSVDDLVSDGWLAPDERPFSPLPAHRVDWSDVKARKGAALRAAADRITASVDVFAWAPPWALDWARHQAISEDLGTEWPIWPTPLRDRDPAALAAADDRLRPAIARHLALQWAFDVQWARLREAAAALGVEIWGDLPMFVGSAGADTWANPSLFRLDADRRPTVVTGAPPDQFTPLGQRWGHAHFDVPAHAASGFAWWLDRVARVLQHTDAVRLDHFRGLAAVWEIPVADEDARGGQWVPSLGAPLLSAIRERFGKVPIIAEDLGVITPDVEALRDQFELPGMAVLQFGFGGTSSPHLPHTHRQRLVVYTGTHDNDTAVGWYDASNAATQDHARRYLSCSGADIAWDLIRVGYRSVADSVVIPLQDALSLDGQARMNTPGVAAGNWAWRCGSEALTLPLARRLRNEALLTDRLPMRKDEP